MWTAKRNKARKTVRWNVTKAEARKKLNSKYPMLQD
jgi:hypothetical protein